MIVRLRREEIGRSSAASIPVGAPLPNEVRLAVLTSRHACFMACCGHLGARGPSGAAV